MKQHHIYTVKDQSRNLLAVAEKASDAIGYIAGPKSLGESGIMAYVLTADGPVYVSTQALCAVLVELGEPVFFELPDGSRPAVFRMAMLSVFNAVQSGDLDS